MVNAAPGRRVGTFRLPKSSTERRPVSVHPIPEEPMLPRPTIEAFDRHLLGLGLRFEGVVIGGSALGARAYGRHPAADSRLRHPRPRAAAGDRFGCARLREVSAPGGRRVARRLAPQRSDATGRRAALRVARACGAHLRRKAVVLSTLGRPDLLDVTRATETACSWAHRSEPTCGLRSITRRTCPSPT